jgi:hypothetical protein
MKYKEAVFNLALINYSQSIHKTDLNYNKEHYEILKNAELYRALQFFLKKIDKKDSFPTKPTLLMHWLPKIFELWVANTPVTNPFYIEMLDYLNDCIDTIERDVAKSVHYFNCYGLVTDFVDGDCA